MANRLIQRTTSGIVYNPLAPAVGTTPAINQGPAVPHAIQSSALTASVWHVHDGIDATGTVRLTLRTAAGTTTGIYLEGAIFANGIYLELASGTGECSVEFGGV